MEIILWHTRGMYLCCVAYLWHILVLCGILVACNHAFFINKCCLETKTIIEDIFSKQYFR